MFTKVTLAILFTWLTIDVCSQHTNPLEENKLFRYGNLIELEVPGRESINLPLKGKKMILDFFSSYCVVCFRMIPKLDSLQVKYKNDVKIILIGKEDNVIRSIYHRFSDRFKLRLSVAFDSTIFSTLKIDIVPRYVWIDENGIVRAVTGVEEMTDENIRLFINNKPIVRIQNEKLQDFDSNNLLFVNGNGGTERNIRYRSLLTDWTPSLPFYIPPSLETNTETDKFQAIGVTFSELYRYAYFGIANWNMEHPFYGKIFPTPLIKKTNAVSIPIESEMRFCYSLYKSDTGLSDSLIKNHLKSELQFYFGYKSRISICEVPCWKLTVVNEKLLPASNQQKTKLIKDAAGFTALNQPISKILRIIYRYNPLEVPIIDCTGITHNVDLKIVASMEDMLDISKSLASFGLKLEKGTTKMQTIILDKEN